MLALLGPLHADLGRDGDRQVTGVDGRLQAGPDRGGELGGGHPTRLAARFLQLFLDGLAGVREDPAGHHEHEDRRSRTTNGAVHPPVSWRRTPAMIGPNPAMR